ncbi:MAG TPA: arylesterase [Bryobacteraceae bacterium]|jgi:acyl-CoA thioesterase-1
MLVPVKLFPAILLLAVLCSCGSNSKPPAHEAEPAPEAALPAAASSPAAAPAPVPDTRKILVVFGDSIAAGYGLEPGQSFPDDVQKKLDAQGFPWRVVNLGISGNTTEEGVARIDSATSLHPAIVLLELGGNDGLRGLPQTVTRQNLAAMIQAFQKAGARVVLAGMTLPPNYGPDYIQGFQKIYKDLAAQYHVTLIPFLLSDIVTPDPATGNLRYFQPDGIHPTADGALIVAETVMRAIKPLLGPPVLPPR